jgi:acetyltransferase-like isoleucine patch superfamily enzyme
MGVMEIEMAYAKIRGHWVGRGKTSQLRVHPRTKVRMERSASFDIEGSLRLGFRSKIARYQPSIAIFGRDSRTTVSGDFSVFSDFSFVVEDGAELELGSGYFNTGAMILCTTKIKIGTSCLFGPQVVLRDDDGHYFENGPRSGPIAIGDNVWVGMRSTILKGATIGEGCVIAAGSVVTREIPPRCLAGGVPCRVIRQNITWRP